MAAASVRPIEVLRIADRKDFVAHGQPRLVPPRRGQGILGMHRDADQRQVDAVRGNPQNLARLGQLAQQFDVQLPGVGWRGGLGGGRGRKIGIDNVTIGDD